MNTKRMKVVIIVGAALSAAFLAGAAEPDGTSSQRRIFASAPDGRPETWFHLIGGNVAKEGLKADIEAIAAAGIGGIHLFHGQMGKNEPWPGMEARQIPCLSEKWEEMVVYAAELCKSNGLSFKMQNCPGWSMSGGPWIAPENAMRNLCFSRTRVAGRSGVHLPRPELATDTDAQARDYRDICVLAFPTPLGDEADAVEPTKTEKPNAKTRIYSFAEPVTLRTIELPSVSEMNHARTYDPDITVRFTALDGAGGEHIVLESPVPAGNWQDNRKQGVRYTFACDEATAKTWRLELVTDSAIRLNRVRFFSAAKMDQWEGLVGWSVREAVVRAEPHQEAKTRIDEGEIVELTDRLRADGTLDWTPPDAREWSVVRIGHVNSLCKNGPAPAEATGWECSKLAKRGIEANYAAYIGRLAKGPLRGLLDGIVVDSWECYRDNWCDELEDAFAKRRGYSFRKLLPAVFGWVVGSPDRTRGFLRDWRGVLGELVEENYYGRLAELAHADGLTVQFETAFGDALAGDLMKYWKYADTPMCEFWHPFANFNEGWPCGRYNFKAVKPCVSAAHLYGFRRVAAESFTAGGHLDFDETLRSLKDDANRHFARGVTYNVLHTYTHNPRTDWKAPGSSFGWCIGTPFLRGQTWWRYMPEFTGYLTRCGEMLETGLPVVDVLRVLGDDLGHKPREDRVALDNAGYKEDYLNQDVLLNRLSVKDGRFTTPEGIAYSMLWIPEGTYLDDRSRARIAMFEAQGGWICRGGTGDDFRPVIAALKEKGLAPDVAFSPPHASKGHGDYGLLWYHRREGARDIYFIASELRETWKGVVRLRAAKGDGVPLELAPAESVFVEVVNGVVTIRSTVWNGMVPRTWRSALQTGDGTGDEVIFERPANGFSFDAVFQAVPENVRYVLEFDRVDSIAEIRLNGEKVGVLWSAPYRCELTRFVKNGENRLSVEVTHTWYNRLREDAAKPESERSTWTLFGPKSDAPERPEGLSGKVRLLWSGKRKIDE